MKLGFGCSVCAEIPLPSEQQIFTKTYQRASMLGNPPYRGFIFKLQRSGENATPRGRQFFGGLHRWAKPHRKRGGKIPSASRNPCFDPPSTSPLDRMDGPWGKPVLHEEVKESQMKIRMGYRALGTRLISALAKGAAAAILRTVSGHCDDTSIFFIQKTCKLFLKKRYAGGKFEKYWISCDNFISMV